MKSITAASHCNITFNSKDQLKDQLKNEITSGLTPSETAKKLAGFCSSYSSESHSELISVLEDLVKIKPLVLCHALNEHGTIDYYKLEEEKKENICHNFSFDSLDSNQNSNFEALSNRLNLPKIVSDDMKAILDLSSGEDVEALDDSFKIVDFSSIHGNEYQIYDGHDSEIAYVTLYDMAHSSREIDGQKFHKFNGVSALFSVRGCEDLNDNSERTNILVKVKALDLPQKRYISF